VKLNKKNININFGVNTMRKSRNLLTFIVLLGLLSTANASFAKENQSKETELTVGLIQKDIKIGTAQADVASILGSPNIVTKDGLGKESWIYDKIGSIASSSSTGFNLGGGGFGGGSGSSGLGGGGGILGLSHKKDTYKESQKTLTVIIKFNDCSQVDSISYHSSKF
jgi:hypothetical protein